jgi:hypothetical protein
MANKLSKERISVLLCTNMTGNEKRPLLAIIKFRNPHCFKNKTILVEYAVWFSFTSRTNSLFIEEPIESQGIATMLGELESIEHEEMEISDRE